MSIYLEYVFSKSAFDYKKESHGQILEEVISLVGAKKVKSPVKPVQILPLADFYTHQS